MYVVDVFVKPCHARLDGSLKRGVVVAGEAETAALYLFFTA